MAKVRQVCFYLTRRCNLRCEYCKTISIPSKREMSLEEIKKAFQICKDLGAELMVLFGGEPLLRKDIKEIAEACPLPYALISNSTLPLPGGFIPENYTASVDVITNLEDNQVDWGLKSSMGFERLKSLKGKVKDLVANTVIHNFNLRYIPQLVAEVDREGFWSIMGLVHTGPEDFWQFRSNMPEFKVTDRSLVEKVCKELLTMKRAGASIHNVDEYFEMMPDNLSLTNWHCWEPYYLTINPDGSLIACPDYGGERVSQMSIFDLPEKWDLYEENWHLDTKPCSGCFYNHMIQVHYGGFLVHE